MSSPQVWAALAAPVNILAAFGLACITRFLPCVGPACGLPADPKMVTRIIPGVKNSFVLLIATHGADHNPFPVSPKPNFP